MRRRAMLCLGVLLVFMLFIPAAEAKVGHIPRGGTVLSFARKPISVSVDGAVIAWSRKTGCPSGLKHCYRGLVRVGSKTVAVPGVLSSADIDLGRSATGRVVAAYVRCYPAAGCSAYSFDPASRVETRLPLALTAGCTPAAPRVAGGNVAYIQTGKGCTAPGLYVADASTGAVAWQAWKTAGDLEAANTGELVGSAVYWSTTLAVQDADSRSQPDRIYRGQVETHVSAPIKRGTTSASFSFENLSVSAGKLFYVLRFSGDEQGASESVEYQTIPGPKRSCRIKGLGTGFDPEVPGSYLLGLAASGKYLYVVLTREDTANKHHPSQLIRYRLSALRRSC
jgi:hypothetical protein